MIRAALATPEPVPLLPVRVVVHTLLFWYVHWLSSGGRWPSVVQAGAFLFLSVTCSLLLHLVAIAVCGYRNAKLTPVSESVAPPTAEPPQDYRTSAVTDGNLTNIRLGKLRFSVRGCSSAKVRANGKRTTIDTGCAVVEVEELS